MPDQQLAVQAVREVQRIPERYRRPCAIIAVASVACMVEPLSVGTPAAQAKQQCVAAMPSDPHGRWWSYRIIDGRKCWYEGKPMLPKSSLEWAKEASEQMDSREHVVRAKPASVKPASALDAQAEAPEGSDTFEARWRARVEQH